MYARLPQHGNVRSIYFLIKRFLIVVGGRYLGYCARQNRQISINTPCFNSVYTTVYRKARRFCIPMVFCGSNSVECDKAEGFCLKGVQNHLAFPMLQG